MEVIPLAIGTLLLASVVGDLLWTTLWVEGGAGPLTSPLMAWTWRTLRRVGAREPRVLTLSGPIVLTVSLVTWIALLWGGWTFVFAGGESSIVDTVNRDPISWSDVVYFAGYAIFTLGNGDFAPQEGIWQILTTLATASGMLFITLSVTYVLNVLSAVTQKRSFASGVSGLGDHGTDILLASWNGEEFEGLELPLNTATTQLNTLTSNHKAYPILHYFHSDQAGQSPTVSVAVFDEALSLLEFGISGEPGPSDTIRKNARASVDSYLDTLESGFIEPADRSPPPPDLDPLRDEGIPVVSTEAFTTALEETDKRRRILFGIVKSDVREWPSRNAD